MIAQHHPPLDVITGVVDRDDDLDILMSALRATWLHEPLDHPDASLTLFAPTDAAFLALAQALGYQGDDEDGVAAYLLDVIELLTMGGDPLATLEMVLSFHIQPAYFDEGMLEDLPFLPTALGPSITVAETDPLSFIDADPEPTPISPTRPSSPPTSRRRTALSISSTACCCPSTCPRSARTGPIS